MKLFRRFKLVRDIRTAELTLAALQKESSEERRNIEEIAREKYLIETSYEQVKADYKRFYDVVRDVIDTGVLKDELSSLQAQKRQLEEELVELSKISDELKKGRAILEKKAQEDKEYFQEAPEIAEFFYEDKYDKASIFIANYTSNENADLNTGYFEIHELSPYHMLFKSVIGESQAIIDHQGQVVPSFSYPNKEREDGFEYLESNINIIDFLAIEHVFIKMGRVDLYTKDKINIMDISAAVAFIQEQRGELPLKR